MLRHFAFLTDFLVTSVWSLCPPSFLFTFQKMGPLPCMVALAKKGSDFGFFRDTSPSSPSGNIRCLNPVYSISEFTPPSSSSGHCISESSLSLRPSTRKGTHPDKIGSVKRYKLSPRRKYSSSSTPRRKAASSRKNKGRCEIISPLSGSSKMTYFPSTCTFMHPAFPKSTFKKLPASVTPNFDIAADQEIVGDVLSYETIRTSKIFYAPTAEEVQLVNGDVVKSDGTPVVLCYFSALNTVPCPLDNLFVNV